jgi:hypothetical protein
MFSIIITLSFSKHQQFRQLIQNTLSLKVIAIAHSDIAKAAKAPEWWQQKHQDDALGAYTNTIQDDYESICP